jgi:hypothetical protein
MFLNLVASAILILLLKPLMCVELLKTVKKLFFLLVGTDLKETTIPNLLLDGKRRLKDLAAAGLPYIMLFSSCFSVNCGYLWIP